VAGSGAISGIWCFGNFDPELKAEEQHRAAETFGILLQRMRALLTR
jgi:hypothetical protein